MVRLEHYYSIGIVQIRKYPNRYRRYQMQSICLCIVSSPCGIAISLVYMSQGECHTVRRHSPIYDI